MLGRVGDARFDGMVQGVVVQITTLAPSIACASGASAS